MKQRNLAGSAGSVRVRASHRAVYAANSDQIVGRYSGDKIRQMILRGTGYVDRDGRVRLIGIGQDHPCRTRTGRGGIMGAIGRGQIYVTLDERGRVDGLRTIYPEDKHIFLAAVTREPV